MTGDAERFEGRATGREATGALDRVGVIAGRVGPILGGFVLPFALVLYLGLEGGGYGVGLEGAREGATNGAILRSEVAIAAWWLLLLGSLATALPFARIGRAAWITIGLFAAFAAWTGLSMLWSDSPERSFDEFTRVLAYLGVFALAVAVQRQGGLRRMVGAVGAAIAVLGILALMSRLHPAWFPVDEAAQTLSNVQARLNYPLDYWNGLAALIGLGIVPLLGLAANGRHLLTQALATAALPALALAGFYTVSRSAPLIAGIGIACYLALHPRRLSALVPLGLGVLGGTLAILAAAQRDALESNLGTAAAQSQGDEMLLITILICAGVGLIRVAAGLAQRHGAGPRIVISRRAATIAVAAVAGICIVGAVATGVPGKAADKWDEFKQAGSPSGDVARYSSASGNGRYQYWGSTFEQNATAPIAGTGAGTFELWWQEHGEIPGSIRDAHSLYFETLGELGIIGLLLLLAVLGSIVFAGVRHALRAPPERRALLAAGVGGCAAFLFAMGVDWGWEIAVLPVAFVLLAAPLVAKRPEEDASGEPERRTGRSLPARLAVVAVAALAIVASGLTLLGTQAIEDSQTAAREGDEDQALDDARHAGDLQPWAMTPLLQESLVLEQAGDLDEAATVAYAAIAKEDRNWVQRITAARIEQERGDDETARALADNARSLYPTFLGQEGQPLPEETGVDYEPAPAP
jgi:hypothetical protein